MIKAITSAIVGFTILIAGFIFIGATMGTLFAALKFGFVTAFNLF